MARDENWILTILLSFLLLPQVAQAQTFANSGTLNTPRASFTATFLDNGKILVAGGYDRTSTCTTVTTTGLSSAELYDPSAGGFSSTGSLHSARYHHTATLLNNGMVLIVGGIGSSGQAISSAELYNPVTGTFSTTGNLNTARYDHTASLLSDGMVLIAGGYDGNNSPLSSAELYNPASGAFALTGNMTTARTRQTATVLNNGLVLLAGGLDGSDLSSAELFDPVTATFAATGSMAIARFGHTATLLNGGSVLVVGGNAGSNSAELYNPSSGVFSATGSLNTGRVNHTATLLSNGMVLVAGGSNQDNPRACELRRCVFIYSSAELYDPATAVFTLTGSLNSPRYSASGLLLNNGKPLTAGGSNFVGGVASCAGGGSGGSISSAELYQPASLAPSSLTSISISPSGNWVPIGSSLSLTATGSFTGGGQETLASAIWTSSNQSVATVSNDYTNHGTVHAVASGTATISACTGSVCGSTTVTIAPHSNLILGSQPLDSARSTFEKYDDSGNRLLTGNLTIPRADHTATLLNSGQIFVAGGTDNDTSWQIFDQNGNVLSSGLLQDGRILQAATLLANGNVFLAGGTAAPGTWEIRSPTGTLVVSGSLNGSRSAGVSAVTLKNGNVWISGSAVANGDACTWEIRSSSGGLVSSGSLNSCFGAAQVQLLNNGNVMLIGGGNAPGTYEIRSQTGAFVTTGSLENAFNEGESSVLLNNGNVFVFGSCFEMNPEPPDPNSCGTNGSPSSWEIRDQNGNFVATGSLLDTRDTAGAVVLSNGNIFITGGSSDPGSWEIRSGTNGSLVSQGSLFDTRYGGHTLTHF